MQRLLQQTIILLVNYVYIEFNAFSSMKRIAISEYTNISIPIHTISNHSSYSYDEYASSLPWISFLKIFRKNFCWNSFTFFQDNYCRFFFLSLWTKTKPSFSVGEHCFALKTTIEISDGKRQDHISSLLYVRSSIQISFRVSVFRTHAYTSYNLETIK